MIVFILWLGLMVFAITPIALIGCLFITGLKDEVRVTIAGIVSLAWLVVSVLYIKAEFIKFVN